MTARHTRYFMHRQLSAALVSAMLLPTAFNALAQDSASDGKSTDKTTNLSKITVTGSLIPQSQIEIATPVTTIDAEEIKARGFSSVAEVLQKSSFATGGVEGGQSSGTFTQGAKSVSLFGLPQGYVKYLIDGRPMSNYPALYDGTDTFNNISGIPIDLIDRIEILPGGQSALYGSDAIAGVINVILKKKLDGAVFSIRGGRYFEGGGNNFRTTFADGWTSSDGRTSLLGGVQYEERDPIWAYQRDLTKQFNTQGYSPQLVGRNFLVYGKKTSYHFLDPARCQNVSGLFNGTEALQRRVGFGDEYYCGSAYVPGYRTLNSSLKSAQVYLHGTHDINDNVQLYGDTLYNHEQTKYHIGSNYIWWNTASDFGYYYDPNIGDLVNLQRSFAPEEMGVNGIKDTMSHDKSESVRVTFGAKGTLSQSTWDYDAGVTYTQYKLQENNFVRYKPAIDQFFINKVLGPQLGVDPIYGTYPVYSPNYAAFYQPISQQEFASFTGYATNKSKTSDGMIRLQALNAKLFSLPGGDAGLAVVGEYGKQKWNYAPDPAILNGGIWGLTAVSGGGQRDRYALTSELRMPVFDPLTITLAGRYDAFKASGRTIDKPTYSVALEYRPFESLLLRGKYGTAFRAPTLSDLYQGKSGYYNTVTDYYQCAQRGYLPGNTDNCPQQYSSAQFFGTQSGNLGLKPINATVWSAGFVWSPVERMALTVDYLNWDISDEVTLQSSDALSLQDYRCRAGIDSPSSALCQAAESQVTRDSTGQLATIYTPKINVSNQKLETVIASLRYGYDLGRWGDLSSIVSYTQNLRHKYVRYAGDTPVDLLNDPYWSTDPKRKADAALTWDIGDFSTTWYANWFDKTPNYAATLNADGYAGTRGGKLPSHITHNASITYKAFEGMELSLMVTNVFNKMPPLDKSYPGSTYWAYNDYNYDVYGRAYYLQMHYAFGK
ncbi:putative tonb-dependent outer membrane receptor protein [Xanthomonas albilineans GPE PC73]|uniref:Putative tonb-dependent outer membrane receptor protein n=2 Tax=Xanthomonas albilineans TaxID=29447 RepID=D2UD28_XANAP|nr:putative tonb-dependent outer membrane receptor protein [Xanthomonas albilineans GPE PC73]